MSGLAAGAVRRALRAWARTAVLPGYSYQAVERYGPRASPGRLLPARLPDGSRVGCDLADHVQRQVYFLGAYEPVEAYLFTRLVRPGAVVVDAGANVGQYALLAASAAGPGGAVHAFEPVPATFARLAGHLAANRAGTVRATRAALWDEPGEVRLGLAADQRGNAGAFSVGAAGGAGGPGVAAPAIRFDDYARAAGVGRVDVVKMDIEGAEWAALRGMAGVLAGCRPVVLMEVNRAACRRAGYDPRVFWDLLAGRHGYTAWRIGLSAADWRPLPGPDGVAQANVLFAPGGLPAGVARGWDYRRCLRWARSGGGGR